MLNKVQLIGRLGKDPEVRSFESGNKVANFSIATSEKYKDKSGEMKESTEWHAIVIWGKLADIVEKYLKKGSQVYIEGKLITRSYEVEGVRKYTTEVVCYTMKMLDTKSDNSSSANPASNQPQAAQQQPIAPQGANDSGPVDDLPF